MNNNNYIELIFSFFKLIGNKSEIKIFCVTFIDKYTDFPKLKGKVLWEDDIIGDEPQEFVWYIPKNNIFLDYTIKTIEFILSNKLIIGDRIKVSESELILLLKSNSWDDDIIKGAIDYLFDLDVRMIDDKEESGNIFVHF